MWKWMGLEEKSSFEMLGLALSSKFDWGSYIISIAKTVCISNSTIWPGMEYCCHVWAGPPSCLLELLNKLQKQICRTVGPLLAASPEPLAHCWDVASRSLFYRNYFSRCTSELAQLFPLSSPRWRSTCYSNRLYAFSVTIPRYYKDVYVNSFFSCTTRLWNSLL